uniref:TIL domain-containing protein n=1 Tax=Strongyloides venezuelensis TaxID=75913 RepID=A0A0K0FCW3_STRVS
MEAKKCPACHKSCNSKNNGKKCIKKCKKNEYVCVCKSKYYMTDDGKCVSRNKCPSKKPKPTSKPSIKTSKRSTTTSRPTTTPVCEEHMEYTACKSICPFQCINGVVKKLCNSLRCLSSGCQCAEPYVKGPYGKCIHREECKKSSTQTTLQPSTPKCPINSTYTPCKSTCQKKCSDKPGTSMNCTQDCNYPACECYPGYVINNFDGKCILQKDCPVITTSRPETTPVCPKNMVYTDCKSACPPKCDISQNLTSICTLQCAGKGCECREPFALDELENCVRREECKNPSKGGYFIIHMIRKTVTAIYTLIFRY